MRTPTPSGTLSLGASPLRQGGSHSLSHSPCGGSFVRRTALAAGSVAGLVLVLLAGCAPTPVPPTMAEVLDGPATAQARTAAFELVDRWVAGFAVPGLSEVARNQVLTCQEGHNDWKTHDGYRLKCRAHDVAYFGWNGDFDPGATSAFERLRTVCTLSEFDQVPEAPAGDLIQLGPQAPCSGGVYVSAEFGAGQTSELLVTRDVSAGSDAVRWVSGPRDAALESRLKTHRWILAVDASSVFYQDTP